MRVRYILCLICLLCFAAAPAYSLESEYAAAPAFVRVITNLCGYNFAAKRVAQRIIKNELNSSITGDFKVKIGSFSGVDLKRGKFKSLEICGEDLSVEDELYITKLMLKTPEGFYYVDYRKKPQVYKTDVMMYYYIQISEDDLNRTFARNVPLYELTRSLPFVQVDNFKFKLEEDKVIICTAVRFPFGKAAKFSITARPEIKNGKIVLTELETSGGGRELPEKLTAFINNMHLMKNIKINLCQGAKTVVSVKNVKVADKKIHSDGTLIIKKTVKKNG